jgi:hypothetical protein
MRFLPPAESAGKKQKQEEVDMRNEPKLLCLVTLLCAAALPAVGQAQQPDSPSSQPTSAVPQAGPDQVPAGTRVLIGLQDDLSTKDDKAGKRFKARTLEPLITAGGNVLPPGAEVHGHIDKVESAGKVGRARIWLTFDDIATAAGRKPLVADLTDAPGVHSMRVAYDHEGEIEARKSKRDQEAQATAEAALVGASAGMAAHDKKKAAEDAALAAATAFLVTSGLGQDLSLPKDTKLEIVLARPLYLGQR